MTVPVITVEDVVKTYDGGHVRALDGVSFTVETGEFVAIMGPSGSGKSTLLHLVAGLDVPDSGRILLNGQDLSADIDLDRFRAEYVGLVFQLDNLLPVLTAAENVEAAMIGAGKGGRERRDRVRELFGELGLDSVAKHRPSALSGGERQRVAIARALANRPSVLVLDEPTGRLDSAAEERVLDLMAEIRASQHVTILLVTHDRDVAGAAERQLTMVDGRLSPGTAGCPDCGMLAALSARYCGACGAALETVRG